MNWWSQTSALSVQQLTNQIKFFMWQHWIWYHSKLHYRTVYTCDVSSISISYVHKNGFCTHSFLQIASRFYKKKLSTNDSSLVTHHCIFFIKWANFKDHQITSTQLKYKNNAADKDHPKFLVYFTIILWITCSYDSSYKYYANSYDIKCAIKIEVCTPAISITVPDQDTIISVKKTMKADSCHT